MELPLFSTFDLQYFKEEAYRSEQIFVFTSPCCHKTLPFVYILLIYCIMVRKKTAVAPYEISEI